MLHRIDHVRRMARFYSVEIRPTLFGEWAVRREWGRIGGASRAIQHTVATRAEAERLAGERLALKRRRGYVPVAEAGSRSGEGSSTGP